MQKTRSPTSTQGALGAYFGGLMECKCNTTILVVVNWFSKICCLILLSGLPITFQTSEALFQNVFHHFGFPNGVISDWSP